MARIIGGIGASHTPTIGFAKDNKSPADPDWADVFKMFDPVKDWLRDNNPDVIFQIYNDHITSFFFDHYSPFVMGVDDEYRTADEFSNFKVLLLGRASRKKTTPGLDDTFCNLGNLDRCLALAVDNLGQRFPQRPVMVYERLSCLLERQSLQSFHYIFF